MQTVMEAFMEAGPSFVNTMIAAIDSVEKSEKECSENESSAYIGDYVI